MVFRKNGGTYTRDRFLRLPEGQRVGALAAVSANEVAALIHAPRELAEHEIRIISISTFKQQTFMTAGAAERLHSLHCVLAGRAVLLVVSSKEGSPTHYRLRAYSIDGDALAESGMEAGGSSGAKVEIVPFACNTWAVITRDGESSARLIFQRLPGSDGSWELETFGEALDGVRGACAIPNERLALTWGDRRESYLEIFDSDGKKERLQNRLFSAADEASAQSEDRHETNGGFLLGCRPVAWHKSLGLLLSGDDSEDGGEVWRVLPKHEEMPRRVPFHEIICHKAFSTERHFLSLEDETALIVLASGALVAGPEPVRTVWLTGGLRPPHVFQEILGAREDGTVIVRAGAWLDSFRALGESEPRVEKPPPVEVSDDLPTGFRTTTPDGWEGTHL